jgi:hypothetical protein
MIQISEERLLELVEAEKKLGSILEQYPEIGSGGKPTSTAKKYKNMLVKLVNKVEEVGNHPSFKSVFEVSYIHGFKYDGPYFADALSEAKQLLKRK